MSGDRRFIPRTTATDATRATVRRRSSVRNPVSAAASGSCRRAGTGTACRAPQPSTCPTPNWKARCRGRSWSATPSASRRLVARRPQRHTGPALRRKGPQEFHPRGHGVQIRLLLRQPDGLPRQRHRQRQPGIPHRNDAFPAADGQPGRTDRSRRRALRRFPAQPFQGRRAAGALRHEGQFLRGEERRSGEHHQKGADLAQRQDPRTPDGQLRHGLDRPRPRPQAGRPTNMRSTSSPRTRRSRA